MRIQAKIPIPEYCLTDLFFTALNVASNYWCMLMDEEVDTVYANSDEECFYEKVHDCVINKGLKIDVYDIKTRNFVGTLDRDIIQQRIYEMCNNEELQYAIIELLNDECDSHTADVIFQYITIGDVIYGEIEE